MDSSVADNHRAVVQRRFVEENIGDDAGVRQSVHLRACGSNIVQKILLFKNHQGAHFLLLQRPERVNNAVDGVQLGFVRIILLTKQAADVKLAASHMLKEAAKLRLKYDDDRQDSVIDDNIDNIEKRVEL